MSQFGGQRRQSDGQRGQSGWQKLKQKQSRSIASQSEDSVTEAEVYLANLRTTMRQLHSKYFEKFLMNLGKVRQLSSNSVQVYKCHKYIQVKPRRVFEFDSRFNFKS